jgi:hypothetical protein
MSETDVMHEIMVEATRLGHRLMRHNTGVATHFNKRGEFTGKVAYGLFGSGGGDLVGWTRIVAGTRAVPVFTMIETKKPGGSTHKRRREQQQQKIDAVKAAGGIAGFCFSVEDYRKLIEEYTR